MRKTPGEVSLTVRKEGVGTRASQTTWHMQGLGEEIEEERKERLTSEGTRAGLRIG